MSPDQTPNKYPKILIVALQRINKEDTANNGLLLRSLFKLYPKDRLAQIFSSGDNGDPGYFSKYYCLGPKDRRLGGLFYRGKQSVTAQGAESASAGGASHKGSLLQRYLIQTGLYELVFRPKLSPEMLEWVREFQPDIILAQGYNLTFAWLPVLLKERLGLRMAFFCSDDWPRYLYSGFLGEPKLLRWLVQPAVERATARLIRCAEAPFAFGHPMSVEYERRYGKPMSMINHADEAVRFEEAPTMQIHPPGTLTLLAAGNFNEFRWPLLLDVNETCRYLTEHGHPARVALLLSAIAPQGRQAIEACEFIDIIPDPGNDRLPQYLKSADLLLLLEGFDEAFASAISLSISSKAHLFMFSRRPIIVYSSPVAGISKYAKAFRWARVIDRRSSGLLSEACREIIEDPAIAEQMIGKAWEVAISHHTVQANSEVFTQEIRRVCP